MELYTCPLQRTLSNFSLLDIGSGYIQYDNTVPVCVPTATLVIYNGISI